MEEPHDSDEQEHAAWNKIFEVLKPPPRDRIQFLRSGYQIQVCGFAWASPWWGGDREGMVHLTGYNEKLLNIWYADLALAEVRYIGPKPTVFPNGKNPFSVKPPALSVELLVEKIRHFFRVRWLRRQTRHIRGKIA